MSRPALEVADLFRDHGAAWRSANAGHVSLDQLKVMSAIERCRTAALGGHVERCEKCSHTIIAYNSCLMGKFRNGELTGDSIGLNVDFRDFRSPLRTALGSDTQLVQRSKGSFARMRWNNDGRWLRDHGTYRFRYFGPPICTATFRIACVSRNTISQRSYLARHRCYGEQTAD